MKKLDSVTQKSLSGNEIEFYKQNGYIVFEGLFSKDEVADLKAELLQFEQHKEFPNVICEDGKIRSVFAPHNHSELYTELYKDQRLVQISKALTGNDLYLYQYKLNLKEPFVGKWWEWHQDFPYWKIDDGVATPDMVSALVYLDDTRSYQGPLMVIPGSHRAGIAEFKKKDLPNGDALINSLSSNLKFSVADATVLEYADANGIEVLELKAGSVIFFHPNLFHASTGNLSPYKRDTVIITYNSINNLPVSAKPRPEYICSKDFTVLSR